LALPLQCPECQQVIVMSMTLPFPHHGTSFEWRSVALSVAVILAAALLMAAGWRYVMPVQHARAGAAPSTEVTENRIPLSNGQILTIGPVELVEN
jgi:hypothetical protein